METPLELLEKIVAAHGRRLNRAQELKGRGQGFVTDDEVDELIIAWMEARLRLAQHEEKLS